MNAGVNQYAADEFNTGKTELPNLINCTHVLAGHIHRAEATPQRQVGIILFGMIFSHGN